ncbi:MAG: Gfo/Idh/MocA family oxidoreductase [Candidatus Latescibacter sp.]|nr:Gfo/Idh/MocA family oxidoreductase [Candidatus Latescibacter sp.]
MYEKQLSRRSFIKTAALAGSAASFGGLIPSRVLGANDRINFGIIGVGGQGGGHLRSLVKRSKDDNIQVVAVCDVFQKRLSEAKNVCGGEGYMDFRKLLDRKDIDAVLIATPDHWHSKLCIDAMDSGKHVYCEKPLTLTVEQAIAVRNAVRKYKKVLQVGPQRTSLDKFWNAQEIIKAGRIGKVTWAQGSWNRNNRGADVFGTSSRRDDPVGPHQTGEDYIDWDMWLGHKWGLAPRVPWSPNRFFYFRGYWDYNGGVATDLLYHFLAPLLLSIVGENGEYPHRVNGSGGLYDNDDGRQVPDVFMMTVDYPSKFTVYLESVLTNEYSHPTRIYGRYGTMEFTEDTNFIDMACTRTYRDKFLELNSNSDKVRVPPEGGRRDMEGNFIDVIRQGGKLHCNVDLGCATMVAIKMGVESYRQSKTLLWDAKKEKVVTG